MSDIKLISPMLDGFCIGEPISDQNGVRCCPAMKENEDDRYIVKVVSIPASQTKLDALLLAGAYPDAESANIYFKELADGIVEELEVLNQLSAQEGFVPIRQWQIVPMDDGETGYDVYMLTDYKRTLKRQFYKEPLTHLNAVNLGLDICAALTVCRRAGYMYTDLKPSNIFVVPEKGYKIGDIGFTKLDSLQYASLSAQYRSAYTAPEVADAFSALSSTMDIYALGLVLYQAYNNGALPFSGDTAPAEVFAAPEYADYEMAEIILKACDPDPEKRWQDPVEMGQALVSYMQRNGANDTPIVPVAPVVELLHVSDPIEVPEEAEQITSDNDSFAEIPANEEDTQDSTADDAENVQVSSYVEDDLGNLSFLSSMDDETTQEVDPETIEYDEVSVELTEILEQVDDLAAHDVPDMDDVIEQAQAQIEEDLNAEEPEPDEAFEAEEEINADAEVNEPAEQNEESEVAESVIENDQSTVVFSAADAQAPESQSNEQSSTDEPVINEDPEAKPKHRWVKFLVVLLILLGLAAGAFCTYKYYYIKTIDSLVLEGKLDTLTVSVSGDADPSLLTVYCIGNGNRTPAELVNGQAHFTNLVPDQRYNVVVEISGFHGLKGKTTSTYYTPSQVALENLQVKVGEADGSAIITFTTKKPYEGKWVVEYVAEGEDKQTIVSDTQSVTLNNLTVGKAYEITVMPENEHNWVTNNTVSFTASALVLAQNVTVADYVDGNLNLVWQAPANTSVSSWTVHCYNDTDYNKTVTVSDCKASFSELDPTKSYTVEIYADNQSKGQMVHIDDTTLPIDSFSAELNEFNFIVLNWTCTKEMPAEGWIISYTRDGIEQETTYTVTENTFTFKEVIPGSTYVFTIDAGNGAPVIVTDVEITAAEAKDFSATYDNYTLTKADITIKMCTPPEHDETWSYKSLYNSDYTNTIKVGEKTGIVGRALKMYSVINEAEVFAFYVIRDKDGNVIMHSYQEFIWKTMWNNYRTALTITEMPEVAGNYTVEVYLNGGFLGALDFEIVE